MSRLNFVFLHKIEKEKRNGTSKDKRRIPSEVRAGQAAQALHGRENEGRNDN